MKFTFEKDIDIPNRGFVLHILRAFETGQQVGYLKVSYICSEKIKTEWPDGFYSWLELFGGGNIYPYGIEKIADLSDDQLCIMVATLLDNRLLYQYNKEDVIKTIQSRFKDRSDMESWLKTDYFKTKSFSYHERKYNDFINHFVDKPFVDYINTEKSENNGNLSDNSRRGIGLLMYKKTSEELSKMGLRLYASNLQTESAKKSWDKMETLGWVKYDGDRKYI